MESVVCEEGGAYGLCQEWEPKGFAIVALNWKEEIDESELEFELDEPCGDWRDLHSFIQKG